MRKDLESSLCLPENGVIQGKSSPHAGEMGPAWALLSRRTLNGQKLLVGFQFCWTSLTKCSLFLHLCFQNIPLVVVPSWVGWGMGGELVGEMWGFLPKLGLFCLGITCRTIFGKKVAAHETMSISTRRDLSPLRD